MIRSFLPSHIKSQGELLRTLGILMLAILRVRYSELWGLDVSDPQGSEYLTLGLGHFSLEQALSRIRP